MIVRNGIDGGEGRVDPDQCIGTGIANDLRMDFDIIVIGGGPAGLSFVSSIANSPLRVAIVERQSTPQLAEPAYDGREIALTHRSRRILRELGAWQHLRPDEISELRSADVLNGGSSLALSFKAGQDSSGPLGWLVSNHLIRRSLYQSVSGYSNVTLLTGTAVSSINTNSDSANVCLATGETLNARLLVAADSRFSSVRDQLGIGAEIKRTGTAMLVCRVAHEREHGHVATEWFANPDTIAMLPLDGRISSAVLTLPMSEAGRLADLDDEALGMEIATRFNHRLGSMRVVSTRHVYPLVMTYSHRFIAPGAALIGDAAVGMHPVTAHGFNLGLVGQEHLVRAIRNAMRNGENWGSMLVLRRFELAHKRSSWPLHTATNAIIGLYRDRRPAAVVARHIGIRLGRRTPFFRRAVSGMLLRA